MEDFERFVQAHSLALLRSAFLLTGDRHLVEDPLQDTLARVAQHWHSVARDGNPEAETAGILGWSVSTVKTSTRAALARLRSGSPDWPTRAGLVGPTTSDQERSVGLWPKTCRRTQACMATAAAAPALMERVEPNCSMCRTTVQALRIRAVSPGPS